MANKSPFFSYERRVGRYPKLYSPKRIIIFVALLLAAAFGMMTARGKVVKVADGDTVTVVSEAGKWQKIRLFGIDAPEAQQRGGSAATEFTRKAALYKNVSVSVVNKDQYGRLVALIHLPDGKILNEELLRSGNAWVYRQFCNQPYCLSWIAMEQEAKHAKRGLWADSNPKAPWNWRKQHPRQ